ncbi:MAG TPA: cytochrome b [Leucothrix mucor]|nr:cytochrome b [Leucothrix mucor]
MSIKNTEKSFGFISKLLHWLMALLLFSLFAVGLYMTSLDYYDPLYHSLPWWHKSFGLLTLFLLLIRVVWKLINTEPKPLKTHKGWEVFLAKLIQRLFYFLILLIGVSGYLISTAKGKGIELFSLFEVPAITQALEEGRADLIGEVHEFLAITLIVLVVLHALAAFKHHFIDKDETLKRMINK